MKLRPLILSLLFLFTALSALADTADTLKQAVETLPPVHGAYSKGVGADWLVRDIGLEADVLRSEDCRDIYLSNGLISRRFRITPNCATVGFRNLISSESILRAVKPEAIVELDGAVFSVGGLSGQPNLAYLTEEWLDSLTADPAAFTLESFTVGEPEKRFDWARIRHCADDAAWPPKGAALHMDYRLAGLKGADFAALSNESGTGRARLVHDDFSSMDSAWDVHVSDSHPRSSFVNEGKPGEIYTPEHSAVYAERELPRGVRLVEVTVDAGTDKSGSWGPGMALFLVDRVVKFCMRPGGDPEDYDHTPRFSVFDGNREIKNAGGRLSLDFSKPWLLRIRMEGKSVFCEAKPEGGRWKCYHTIAFDDEPGDPVAVRIGKLGPETNGLDHANPGRIVRLKIQKLTAWSSIDPARMNKLKSRIAALKNIRVSVHYELYDGVPVMSKWVSVHNGTGSPVTVNNITAEILAAVEHSSIVEYRGVQLPTPNIHVETDHAFGGMRDFNANHHTVHWESDPGYSSQVNYLRVQPCLLKVYPDKGINMAVESGGTFESYRVFVMPYDSYDRERTGLARRRMYRTIAPWVTENPLMMHLRYSDPEHFRQAVDQCAEVGFEMLNLSFGSGFNIENESPEYIAQMKEYRDYAENKGITIGGYSLLASRRVSDEDDVVNPKTGKPGGFATFGNSPCLGSRWGLDYFRKLYSFFEKTGFVTFTHDGAYPGDVCASTSHPGHKNLYDSQYSQWKIISDFYKWCRGRGVYLRIPDFYYLVGGNECGMGYREVNWSLPRAQQVIHTRQNIYDGTWTSTPTMRWMFVPLTQYHGGGEAATVEPLSEHLDHYELMMVSNMSMGVQAVYRGPRLYDTEETKRMVAGKVAWFKKYRTILESDLLHLRRADGMDLDYMMHVNPYLKECAFLTVFNPTDRELRRTISLPLYYSGLTDTAMIREQENPPERFTLDRQYNVTLEVTVPANGYNWYVIEKP